MNLFRSAVLAGALMRSPFVVACSSTKSSIREGIADDELVLVESDGVDFVDVRGVLR